MIKHVINDNAETNGMILRYRDILVILILSLTPGVESRGAFLYYASLRLNNPGSNDPLIFILILLTSYAPSLIILNLRMLENAIIYKSDLLKKIYHMTLSKVRLKADKISKYRSTYIGLTIFIALPIPGTGVWTGSLVAYVLGLDKNKSFTSIFVGNAIACTILYLMVFVLSEII